MGQGTFIVTFAGLVIGERLIPKTKRFHHLFILIAALVGGLLYQVLVAVAIHMGLAAIDLKMVTAALVLVAMAMKNSQNKESLTLNNYMHFCAQVDDVMLTKFDPFSAHPAYHFMRGVVYRRCYLFV